MKHVLFLLAITLSSLTARAEVRIEEDFSLPIVYVNIATDVGAVNDPADKLGLANIASRMLLRGTTSRSKNDFFKLINKLGGSLEVDVRSEGTVFRGAVLSENLDKFLALVEETLTRPKFTSEELAKLKSETEGAILELKGNDQGLVQYHFYRFLYGDHPYGNPVIGTRKTLAAIKHGDIVNFYAQNFSGKTLHLFATGAAKHERLEKWFESLGEKLSAIHPEARPVAPIAPPEMPAGRRVLIVDKPKTTQTQVLLGGKGMRPEASGFYPTLLANHSYGGPSFQARMMREIRVKRGWTYGASNSFRFGRQPRHFAMYVFPKTADTIPAISLMLDMFGDFVKNGITREEYQFARDSLVNNAPFNYDTPRKRIENATTEHLINFPDGYFKNFATNIESVSYDEILPALQHNLNPDNLALTIVGDKTKLLPLLNRLPGFSAPVVKSYLED